MATGRRTRGDAEVFLVINSPPKSAAIRSAFENARKHKIIVIDVLDELSARLACIDFAQLSDFIVTN
jgi:hypothetical protein